MGVPASRTRGVRVHLEARITAWIDPQPEPKLSPSEASWRPIERKLGVTLVFSPHIVCRFV